MNRPRSRTLRFLQIDPPGEWVLAERAFRCEGVDPFGDRRLLSSAVIDAPGLWVLAIAESAPARGAAALRP